MLSNIVWIISEKVAIIIRIQGGKGSRLRMNCPKLKELQELYGDMLKNYKDLKVWQKSYQLSLVIYKTTKGFPKEERYSLTSQIRRAAVSVVSNIAEGYGRKTTPDYIRSLYVAYGSHCELETQILLAGDLGYITPEQLKKIQTDIAEVERMLKALIKSLENKHLNP
jgi:four helix bundle protein